MRGEFDTSAVKGRCAGAANSFRNKELALLCAAQYATLHPGHPRELQLIAQLHRSHACNCSGTT
jgi:hypothetical protein